MRTLAERVLSGEPRAVARAISLVEDEDEAAPSLVKALFPHSGRARTIGVTGPPGAGKSTLVDRLAHAYRQQGSTVGIVAVDPTSPFSGGAVLGDRVRMQAHAGDAGVFIRSMATRGQLGGLSRATAEAAMVLDAAGRDVVFIETVGVGQDEVDIARTADVTVIVLVPGTGDDVQAIKAGIMEIGDVFVVNKADREGADRAVASVEAMLQLNTYPEGAWRPPVLRTVATTEAGIQDLVSAVERFLVERSTERRARRHHRERLRLNDVLVRRFLEFVESNVADEAALDQYAERIAKREVDPYTVTDELLTRALGPQPHRNGRPR